MIPEEVKKRWIQVAQFLQQQGLEFIKANPPVTNEDALRLMEVGVRIEREVVEGRDPRGLRNNKPLFAVVPYEDAELLQAMEDQMDLDLARKALKRNDAVAWDDVKKELGLVEGAPIEGQTDEPS